MRKILSIDAAGVRGMIPATILAESPQLINSVILAFAFNVDSVNGILHQSAWYPKIGDRGSHGNHAVPCIESGELA